MHRPGQNGFTLPELLLVMAIVGIVFAFSLPVARSALVKNNLNTATTSYVDSLRKAQGFARHGFEDDSWGVYIETGQITVFKGDDFTTRDSSFDEIYEIASSITPSGVTEQVFSQTLGLPQSSGTTTLTDDGGNNQDITINSFGTVGY